nr:basigin [Hymenolepis microstoma]
MSSIQYESIQFQKRAKNDSLHLVLKFGVVDVPSKSVTISLLYNNQSISVGDPNDRMVVYAEKRLNSSGFLTDITLNLKNSAANSGLYELTLLSDSQTASAVAEVDSAPILPVYSKPKRVLQGDPLRISCRVSSYPTPVNVSWFFAPIPVELSDDKTTISEASGLLMEIDFSNETWKDAIFSSEEGTPNDTLKFESIGIAQNGLFACNVSNAFGSDSTFLLVGVKDRWAALWPFVAIVVEVTLLVTAILLYERHQIRKKPTTSEPAAATEATSPIGNAVDKSSKLDEVRLRNTRA